MTKLIKYIRSFTAMVLIALSVIAPPIFGDFTAETEPLEENCKLYFAAISDIHMTEETARRDMLGFGLMDMQESKHTLDAVVCTGDLTEHGEEEQWAMLEESFSLYNPAKNIILAQGNHDTWTGDDDYDKSVDLFVEYNEKIAGRKITKPYYSTKINGYTFIVLASESDSTSAYIGSTQRKWLKSEMQKAEKDGLPIFVVCHWPLNQTHGLPGTWGDDEPMPDDGGIGMHSAKVEKILKSFDNVFLISGHIHSGFSTEAQVKFNGYASVESDGSFHSINLPSYMYPVPRGRVANGTGFNIEVYEDKVEIRARSYSAGVWYTLYNFTIDLV